MSSDLSSLSYETLVGIKSGIEHLYAAQLFSIALIVATGICYLLYKAIKTFY